MPFRLDTRTTSAQRLHDLNHDWHPLHASWNGGRMNGWVSIYRSEIEPDYPVGLDVIMNFAAFQDAPITPRTCG